MSVGGAWFCWVWMELTSHKGFVGAPTSITPVMHNMSRASETGTINLALPISLSSMRTSLIFPTSIA